MQQAPMLDGFAFELFSVLDDGSGLAKIGVGGRQVVQALVIAPMIVALDEGLDLVFKVSRMKWFSRTMRFFKVLSQRSILPCVWGCIGAPRT